LTVAAQATIASSVQTATALKKSSFIQ